MSELSSKSAYRSETALSHRIEELDSKPQLGLEWPGGVTSDTGQCAAARLGHFVSIMSRWTEGLVELEVGPRETITPETADALAGRSRLVAEIERFDPSLVAGPMDRIRQHWTPIGRSAYKGAPPSEKHFIAPQADQRAAVKPPRFGLYTSTVSAAGVSMWSALLGLDESMMYRLSRYTWELEIDSDVTVAEIGSATAWVEFVCAHARISEGLVYPDWVSIAHEWDAIHVTLPAIAAAQGFHFSTSCGVMAPAFWDVESTVWLRWCFSGARLVESVDPD